MGGMSMDGFKVCEKCGSFYLNFCLHCEKAGIDERVWEIMGRHNLNEEELIRLLAEHVQDGNFNALNLAITMRDMKPSSKSEVKVTDGGEIREARDRLASLLDRLVRGNRRPE